MANNKGLNIGNETGAGSGRKQVAYSALKPLVDSGQITPQQIADKVAAGEIAVVDDSSRTGGAVVQIPGVGNVQFPPSMDEAAITKAIEQEILPHVATGPRPQPQPAESPSVGGFLQNVVTSGAKVATDIGTAIAHPIKTAGAIMDVGVGALEKGRQAVQNATTSSVLPAGIAPDPTGKPLRTESIPKFDAVVNSFKERYGDWQSIKKTAYEDPVGFLLDASALLTGGGTAAERAGLTTAAKVLRTAGEVTDPIRQTLVVGSKAVTAGAKVAAPVVGKLTGTGTETLTRAAGGSDAFTDAMRTGDHSQIVSDLKDSVQQLVDKRQNEYQAKLKTLPNVQLSAQPVVAELRSKLADFGVKVKQAGQSYVADFSNSKITDMHQQMAIQDVIDDVATRMNKPLSVADMDTLKQRIAQRIGQGGGADKIITAAKEATANVLNTQVPGYADMTKGYAEASNLLDKVKSEFSVGNAGKEGTSIRKLQTALNQRNDFRKTLLELIDQETGSHLGDAVAGADMSSGMPRGLMGTLVGHGVAFGGGLSYAMHSPEAFAATLAVAAMSSPRFVGEALRAISKARRAAKALPSTVAPVAAPLRDVTASGSGQ